MEPGTSKSTQSTDYPEYNEKTNTILDQINAYQEEINTITIKIQNEIIQTERKFNQLKKPHLKLREDTIKKIPNFWSIAFANHPLLSNFFESLILKYLSKLKVQNDSDGRYDLEFHFDINPYFENEILRKDYNLDTLGCTISTNLPIEWKKGVSLPLGKSELCLDEQCIGKIGSFWEWYEEKESDMDIIADAIKDDLWIDPLKYFLPPDEANTEIESTDEDLDANFFETGTSDEAHEDY
ncbi:hypothetical protein RN001_015658 [Aquatica leii]|uniref:Nucleosome assembly protein n=1 Tax=Aquatica leii TaxID=1421715 RepID=A0AAN7PMA0_9COLE|nr:hypothetical protein RN001_015658 [Aquatica leii]